MSNTPGDQFGFSVDAVCVAPGERVEFSLVNGTDTARFHSWWGVLTSLTSGDEYQVYSDPAGPRLIPGIVGSPSTVTAAVAVPQLQPGDSATLALIAPDVVDDYALVVYGTDRTFSLAVAVSPSCP